MVRRVALGGLALALLVGCDGSSGKSSNGGAGTDGAADATSHAGASGGAGASGSAGTTGSAGATAGSGGAGASGSGGASGASGAAGGAGGTGSAGSGGAGTSGVDAGNVDATPADDGAVIDGPRMVPAGYTGTPYTLNKIPGRINAADYDRGGAGVAWCHNTGGCGGGTTTGDWYPAGSPPYRAPMPANAKICSGAACDDNVGVCRMSPNKPDKINATTLAPAADTYLCYSTAGEWTKYTVVVQQAGTYAVGGFMAVPQGGGVNVSFSASITTGNLTLAVTDPSNCGGGEFYHCWMQRENLATVTFPSAGIYLMTLTQVGRFNADNFTFTKM
jgi:hypothetical protein